MSVHNSTNVFENILHNQIFAFLKEQFLSFNLYFAVLFISNYRKLICGGGLSCCVPYKSFKSIQFKSIPLREKYPDTELFLVGIFLYTINHRIQSECWKIRTRDNSVFGHFSRGVPTRSDGNKTPCQEPDISSLKKCIAA